MSLSPAAAYALGLSDALTHCSGDAAVPWSVWMYMCARAFVCEYVCVCGDALKSFPLSCRLHCSLRSAAHSAGGFVLTFDV